MYYDTLERHQSEGDRIMKKKEHACKKLCSKQEYSIPTFAQDIQTTLFMTILNLYTDQFKFLTVTSQSIGGTAFPSG